MMAYLEVDDDANDDDNNRLK